MGWRKTVGKRISWILSQDVARKLLESCRGHGEPIPMMLKKIADRVELDVAVST